jgi:Spy/CpxP family protein refolding chaperone
MMPVTKIALSLGLVALLILPGAPHVARGQEKQPPPFYVEPGKDGKLVYETDARGNRIPDFSQAGYRSGVVPIPEVPVRVTVAPVDGDDGARIQAALDYVSRLPADTAGFRGAVLLGRGRFEINDSLILRTSGVVLRGQGDGSDGTVLIATGNNRRTLIEVRGVNDRRTTSSIRNIVNAYVPVNARDLELDTTAGLNVGDAVIVRRPSPKNWLEAVGMTAVPGRPAPGWTADKMDVVWERRIEAVNGSRVTLDAPLTCALEKEFGGGTVTEYAWPGRVRNVGVENLRCESEWDQTNPRDEEHAWMAISLENVEDAWVRQVTAAHFVSSAVNVLENSRRVTVADCASLAPVSEVGGYRRHSFYTAGQQILFLRCRAEEGRHDFSVGWLAAGPNAFVECETRESHDFSGPIESWATGVLYDGIKMDGGGLRLDNRELWDNGVGWAAANSVFWQCSVPIIVARTPPGAQNWVLGCWAQFAGDAKWRSPNEFVKPDSLYAAQLTERLGADIAATVLKRREIPTTAGNVPTIDAVPRDLPTPTIAPPSAKKLTVQNGWLVVEGRLLVGGPANITWWRGNTQPNRAADFGISLTRFAPGRTGPGQTDDLYALTDQMASSGKVSLRHHWGLWYDRRRDDHEMIRRVDASAWPPFYESPWARSGKGRAWDGLSRYDLTKFNPWYFGRLRTFADLCDRKGLLFVNAMYFQHNILEAGAHWADFPWRPANCLQETGFTEPPPYAGGKRIFMADAFYDVTHPVRRALHRAYIRQCLNNLADRTNVVHVLGEEYSGPLHFMQFWLDTVAEWRAETGKRVLIGLSAPKDVQDAILADPKRSAQIDVIDFKYWWRVGDKEYAPKGGQNLAPRQHEREWKGGRPDDADLARMAAEYRARYPKKAILCDFDKAGWAFVAAGGSVPNLPRTTDPRLLAALPRMAPWAEVTNRQQWALCEPGKNYLIYSAEEGGVTLDLGKERGAFIVYTMDPQTGTATATSECRATGAPIVLKKPNDKPTTFWITQDAEAAYTESIRQRADNIVTTLGIADAGKANRVQSLIMDQYRSLRDIHDTRDARLKEIKTSGDTSKAEAIRQEAKAQLDALHQKYLTKLAAELTPEQIEKVKDGMTYGVAPNTYRVYLEMLPDLTDEQRRQIKAWLEEARENAMDAGTSQEKHAWFGKYKGKINNFLSAAGYDMKRAEKAYLERRKTAP